MEIVHASQVGIDEVLQEHFDLFIFGGGFDRRCCFLLDTQSISAQRKILFKYTEPKILKKVNEGSVPDIPGLEVVNVDADNCHAMKELLQAALESHTSSHLRILMDYSCMSKNWYATAINYLILNDTMVDKVSIFFSYTPSYYFEPSRTKKSHSATPLLCDHRSQVLNGRKKALLIGLGFDPENAKQLIKTIDPDIIFLLYSDPSFDERFTDKVLELNKKLVQSVGPANLIPYPVHDMDKTDAIITSLCIDLRLSYKVYIAPVGPKILSLSCLLLFARYPDIEIWTVDAGFECQGETNPKQNSIIFKASFINDDEEY
jgi:hypothetical protein